jgi:hypothetical protein
MNIDLIQQTELTADQREVLAQDRERWQRMGAGHHLDDWLAFGPGQHIRRTLAMKIAHTNKPEGRAYNEAMAALLHRDRLHTMDKASLTAVLWLHDTPTHMSILNEIRACLTEGQRSRLNSPITARQRVEKELKVRSGGIENKLHKSMVASQKHQLAEQERQIAHLDEKLAAAEARGSLFDLQHDNVDNIARAIVGAISAAKAKKLAEAISAALRAKPKRAG